MIRCRTTRTGGVRMLALYCWLENISILSRWNHLSLIMQRLNLVSILSNLMADIFDHASRTYYDVVNRKNAFLQRISCDFKKTGESLSRIQATGIGGAASAQISNNTSKANHHLQYMPSALQVRYVHTVFYTPSWCRNARWCLCV